MLWTEELFGVKKPIISMLHLDPLPGDPRWKATDSLATVIEHARHDLHALQDGGVDGILDQFEKDLKPATIVATGGLATKIAPYCRHQIVLDENLLLKGLKIIYDKNKKPVRPRAEKSTQSR